MALYTNDLGTYFDNLLLEQIKQRNNDEVRFMLRKVNPSCLISSSSATLLHYAAEYGNEEITQYLVELGSDVNAQNQIKETPLMLALEGSFKKTIGVLLAANADVFMPDIYGKSTLWRLFNNNKPTSDSIITMFLDKVASDKRDDAFVADQLFEVNCPLYLVVLHLKKAEVTRLLLGKGRMINVTQPQTNKTALHIAVEHLDLENVKVLLDHKADVHAKDCDGRTPLSVLPSVFKLLGIMKLLLSKGSVLVEDDCAVIPLNQVLVYGSKQAIWTYLQNQVDFHAALKAIIEKFLNLCHHFHCILISR